MTLDSTDVDAAYDASYCPLVHGVIELIGRRWTGAILKVLLEGRTSFGHIKARIPGLSDRLLAERLSELADAGFVERDAMGREAFYELTAKGEDLRPVFDALGDFCVSWSDSINPAC